MTVKTNEDFGKFMWDFIKQICDSGSRPPTSQAEKEAANCYENELKKYCTETIHDKFITHPNAYPTGFVRLAASVTILGFSFFIFSLPLIFMTPILCLLGLFIFFTVLFFQKEWVDFLFKKKESQNVFGKIKPQNSPKYLVILGGHLDSAWESGVIRIFGKRFLFVTLIGLSLIFYTLILSLIKCIFLFLEILMSTSIITVFSISIISITLIDFLYFIPLLVGWFWIYLLVIYAWANRSRAVHGANDNLSGAAISLGVARYLQKHLPKNVEVWCGAFGCEECGDKGSKAFVEKYGKQGRLNNSCAIIPESCGAGKELMIWKGDKMHRAVYREETFTRLFQAYHNLKAENPDLIECYLGVPPLGSSDGCRFSHKGYHVTTISGVDDSTTKRPSNWHSRNDVPENIDPKILKQTLDMCLTFIELLDQELEGN